MQFVEQTIPNGSNEHVSTWENKNMVINRAFHYNVDEVELDSVQFSWSAVILGLTSF